MRKIGLFLLSVFLTFSCDRGYEFTEYTLEREVGNCELASCCFISITALKSEGDSPFSYRFNQKILSEVSSFIYGDSDVNFKKKSTINEVIDSYLKNFSEDTSNIIVRKELIMVDSISFQNDNLVSLKENSYVYSGGAHGINRVQYYNFDAKTGEVISQDSLFVNKEIVTELADQYFREHYNIAPNEDFDQVGFWFSEGFELPENIGFTDKDMILYYNPYEIAPYAQGPTCIRIPLSKISNVLRFINKE